MSTEFQPFAVGRPDVEDHGEDVVHELRALARPLDGVEGLDPLLRRIGDARVVVLGAGAHGAHEHQAWRARVTKRLIEEKGFDFVAIEGDGSDFERLNRFVRGRDDSRFAGDVLRTFQRWPAWMWGNQDVVELAEWMRGHNERSTAERQVGVYGLDGYGLWDSMARIVGYLDGADPEAAKTARHSYECFAPQEADGATRASRLVPPELEDAVVRTLCEARHRSVANEGPEREQAFRVEQDDLLARHAEAYYRGLVGGGPAAWNVRTRHMGDTLDRLLEFYGSSSKVVVWAHDGQAADARFTSKSEASELSLGQLAREGYGEPNVVLVGLTSYSGFVCASDAWGAPMEEMIVPPGHVGSLEEAMHQVGARDALYLFDASQDGALAAPREHRGIGVVYRPKLERRGNYVSTVVTRAYDAMVFIDETRALRTFASG